MTTSVVNFVPSSTVLADFKKLYADSAIDEATIYSIDLSNPASWPSQAASAGGESVLNLVEGGDPATVNGALTYSNGGLNISISGNQRIVLPAAAKLGAGVTDFLWAYWFFYGAQTQAVNEIGGYHYADTGPYGMRTSAAGTGVMICSGVTRNVALAANNLYAAHIALEQVSPGNFLAHFFLNGVLLESKAVVAPLQQPSTAVASAGLGDVAGTTYGATMVGRMLRSWLTTKHRSTADIKQWVEQDYQLNAGYFA